jgi:hypothetical protein
MNMIFRYWSTALRGEYEILRYMFAWLYRRTQQFGLPPVFHPTSVLDMRMAIECYTVKTLDASEDHDLLALEDISNLINFLGEGLTPDAVDLVSPLVRYTLARCWVEVLGLEEEPNNRNDVMRVCGSALS